MRATGRRGTAVAHAWSPFCASAAIGLTATLILTGSGVTLGRVVAMAGYEAAFILLPGYAAYRLLFAEDARLSRQLTFAWGLGYVIEVFLFALTAAANVRGVFLALPVLALLCIGITHRRTGRPTTNTREPISPGIAWTFAAVSSLSLAYVWLTYFLDNPLPGTVPAVSYYVDTVHDLALAAEALHHWPIMDPHVHGEAFGYYLFPFMHMAAISQVTGLELPVVVLRLFIVPVFIALLVQTYYLGTVAGRGSRLAGVLCSACVLLIGELDLSASDMYPFYNIFFSGLLYSPTFLLGLIVFIPVVASVADHDDEPFRARSIIALSMLLVGCVGTKGQVLPMLLAALIGFLGWVAVRERRMHKRALVLTVVAGALLVGLYAVAGSRTTSIAFHPLLRMPRATNLPGPLPWILGFAGLVGMRVIGLIGSLRSIWRRGSSTTTWFLILAAAGIVPAYLFDMGSGEFYFLSFSYVVLSALTGAVLTSAYRSRKSRADVLTIAAGATLGLAGLCDLPLDYGNRFHRYLSGEAIYATTNQNLTRDLWKGLVWARDHLPKNAVLAVNNQSLGASGDWRYFYYSAFAERHTFLGGWMYSDRTHAVGYDDVSRGKVHPFPDRLALNNEVFSTGGATAIASLHSRGVTHLLVDKVHGHRVEALETAATRVFSNNDVDIYAIGAHN